MDELWQTRARDGLKEVDSVFRKLQQKGQRAKCTVPIMRKFITFVVRLLFCKLEQYPKKFDWNIENKPLKWTPGVPFKDPNNQGQACSGREASDSAKPRKKELALMFDDLWRRYEDERSQLHKKLGLCLETEKVTQLENERKELIYRIDCLCMKKPQVIPRFKKLLLEEEADVPVVSLVPVVVDLKFNTTEDDQPRRCPSTVITDIGQSTSEEPFDGLENNQVADAAIPGRQVELDNTQIVQNLKEPSEEGDVAVSGLGPTDADLLRSPSTVIPGKEKELDNTQNLPLTDEAIRVDDNGLDLKVATPQLAQSEQLCQDHVKGQSEHINYTPPAHADHNYAKELPTECHLELTPTRSAAHVAEHQLAEKTVVTGHRFSSAEPMVQTANEFDKDGLDLSHQHLRRLKRTWNNVTYEKPPPKKPCKEKNPPVSADENQSESTSNPSDGPLQDSGEDLNELQVTIDSMITEDDMNYVIEDVADVVPNDMDRYNPF